MSSITIMSSVIAMTSLRMMLASCLCALAGVAASGQVPGAGSAAAKQADAAFHEGYAAANAGDLERARSSFAEVVRLEPKIAEGHAALGSVLLNLGRSEEAATELKRGLALRPGDRDIKMNLALAEARSGQSAEALKLFQELATAGSSLPPEVEIGYAQALTQSGRRSAALERLHAAAAAAPENAALHDALGSLLAQEQQWTAAQPEFARAVELDPKAVAPRLHLGTVLMQLNQPSDAAATLELAHDQQPQDVDVMNELALSYSALGDYDKALPLAQEAMRLAPQSSAAAYQAAIALQGLGRDREATPLFAHVVDAEPKNASALTNYALALVQQGNAKDAIPLYQRAVTLTPNDPVVHEDFGVAYLQQSDIDDAIREFQAGLKLDSDNQQLHYNLGLAYKLKDDTARAVPELELAARLDPDSPDPAYTLGVLYMQAGRFGRCGGAASPHAGTASAEWRCVGSAGQRLQAGQQAAGGSRRAAPCNCTAAESARAAHYAGQRAGRAGAESRGSSGAQAGWRADSGRREPAARYLCDEHRQYAAGEGAGGGCGRSLSGGGDQRSGLCGCAYGLATALERQGRTAQAAAERAKAAALAKPNE